MAKKNKGSRRHRRGAHPRPPSAGDEVQITDGVELPCPNCGAKVILGHDQHGRPTGMHAQPACAIFMALELDEYCKWVRQKYEGTTDA